MVDKTHLESTIPKFGLYGEQALKQNPEFVHIEDIADRSSKNGWLIKPHRHTHLFQILCMYDGELELKLDDVSHSLKGSWVITVPTGVVHGFRFHPKTQGVVLSLATNMLNLEAQSRDEILLEDMMTQTRIAAFEKNSQLHQHLRQYLDLIKSELALFQQGQPYILEALVKMVLMTFRRQQQGHFDNARYQAGAQLISRFRILLEEHYKKHWKVSDYAEALHISVSSLNRTCREAQGMSAKALVQERLLVEAKRQLIYTREALDQIAYTLGFKDPAYFSRVFKQQEGRSPREFRQIRA